MKARLWSLPMLGCMLVACADIRGVPADLEPARIGAPPSLITLAHDHHVGSSTGYNHMLHQGSVWSLTGSVPQGDVYKPRETVFTLEGINMHEAYLVLSGRKVVGYYLPAERSYVAETRPFEVALQ